MATGFAWLAIWALPLQAYASAQSQPSPRPTPSPPASPSDQDDAKRRAEAEELRWHREHEDRAARSMRRADEGEARRAAQCALAEARQRAVKARSIEPKIRSQRKRDEACTTCKPPECD